MTPYTDHYLVERAAWVSQSQTAAGPSWWAWAILAVASLALVWEVLA